MDSQPLAQLMPVAGTHEVFEDQARLEQDVMAWLHTIQAVYALAAKPQAVQLQPAHQ